MPATTAPVPARDIEIRRPGLEYPEPALPKYFVADDILRSHIAAMWLRRMSSATKYFGSVGSGYSRPGRRISISRAGTGA
ncbi:MAG: hypothetical protein ACO1PW_04135, partial [Actinomycetota bacterium]